MAFFLRFNTLILNINHCNSYKNPYHLSQGGPIMVRDVKITVLKTSFNEDLAKDYGVPNLGTCPCNKVGQVYISKGGLKPDDLCDDAWEAFGRFVFALAHGVNEFFPDWVDVPKTTINCCNDGIRPVIFKCEVLEEGE